MFVSSRNSLFIYATVLAIAVLSWTGSASAQAGDPGADTASKKTIFVGVFESPEQLGGAETGAGLSAMLTNALVQDGRFVVVERYALSDVQGEQQLGTQGSTTAETAPKTGQLIGARLLVRGTVTKFNPQAAGGSINVGGPVNFFSGLGNSIGVSDTTATVEIALRLIDTTTGQILYAGAATGTASAKGFNAQLYTKSGYTIGGSAFQNTPLGEAAQDAINKALAQLVVAAGKVQ